MKDEPLRKHLPRMFSLIKNESWAIKALDFVGDHMKTVAKDLLPMLKDALATTPANFDSFNEVLSLHERGLPLPDTPLVRKFLELAPSEKFRAILLPGNGQCSSAEPPEKFADLIPVLKDILNLKPHELGTFKEVMCLHKGGLPLPDIPLLRKLLALPKVENNGSSTLPEDEPFKKLNDLVPMLKVVLNFTPNQFESFKKAVELYRKGSPLPNDPLVRLFLAVAPCEIFKDVLRRAADEDNLFKFPEDAPLKRHFKGVLPMLLAVLNFTPNERDLFKEVLNHYEGGSPLPDIPLIQKFLQAAPCEKFTPIHLPSIDRDKLFQFSKATLLGKFKNLIPMFTVILNLNSTEFDSLKNALDLFEHGSPLQNHPIIRKILEVAPSEKFKGTLKNGVDRENLFTSPEDAESEEDFKGIFPMLKTAMNLTAAELGSFKEVLGHHDGTLPLQDIPIVQKFLEVAPTEDSKVVLTPAGYQNSLFRLPEAAPLEKSFNGLQPMLNVIMDLNPGELESLKEVLGRFESGLPLPDIPVVQQFLDIAPCEKFDSVLIPSIDPGNFSKEPEGVPSEKFKDIFPMLHAITSFTPAELHSFKEGIDLYKSGSPLKSTPLLRKVLDAAPNKKFKEILTQSVENDSLFSLPQAAPLEKYFNGLLPAFQAILNMTKNDFSSFKEVVDNYKDGLPLPDIPVVQDFLKVAPCEKFKTLLMPITGRDGLFSLPEAAPLENYFKDHLPMLQFILNLPPNEFHRFKEVLGNYEDGLSLPDVPLIRNFLEVAPCEKFKDILKPGINHESLLGLPEDAPKEKFKDLLPMLQLIVNFTADELSSFREALDVCEAGNPLPDVPLIRKFLQAAPYEKFRSIIAAADQGCLFKLPEGAHLEKYFKALLPMLKSIVNFKANELQLFKEVLDKYGHGLPLPGIPLVQKFLEVAPCEKFRVVLKQNVSEGNSIEVSENAALKKFRNLLPMLRVVTNFIPKEFDSFKSFLDSSEDGSSFPDTPVLRKLLEVTPYAKFNDGITNTGDKGGLFKLPEGMQLKKYFKPLLPALKMIMNLKPNEFDPFKEALKKYEDGSPLPDVPAIHKLLEVAPCEFEPVLMPAVGHDSLFRLPESEPMEKHFKDILPMFQPIVNFTPNELSSFKNMLSHYEYGLPLPDSSLVRKFLEVAPDEKFKDVLTPSVQKGNLFKFHEDAPLQKLKDIIPVLRVVINFKTDEFNTFKKIMDQCESGLPLPDIPLVRKFLEATPFENLKEILTSVEKGSLFKSPEAAPLEKYFKDLLPILKVVFNLMPNELESFKEMLDHYDCGLALPHLPLAQEFLKVAPCEKFKAVLMPDIDHDSLFRSPAFKPFKKFKDIFPTLQVIMNFTPEEIKSFREVLDHCKKGSSLPDIPLVRKLLEAAPDEKFKAVLAHDVDQGSLFSSPQAAPLEKYFEKLVPMFQTIMDFADTEFDSFKEVLGQYKDGLPLPNNPLVKKFLEVAPCEKFKPIFMPKVDQDSLFRLAEDAPLEKYFKGLLPQFKAIINMAPNELETFNKVLRHYEAGLPLPNIPLVQKFLEVAPDERFKTLFTPSLLKLPEIVPLENFKDLLPMMLVILKFTPNEFKSFKEVLGSCKDGSPLPDTPQVRKFLEAAPYEKFKAVLALNVDQGSLFKLPEAAPLEKFFKDLLPMLKAFVNFTPMEFDSFKEVFENYKNGLPFPNTPLISKFLEIAPCNKFKAILMPTIEKDSSPNSPKEGPSKKFKDMLPMLNVVNNLTPNESNSFKDLLHRCKAGLPLPDIPLVRKVLEVAPCEKFKDILAINVGQKSLFSLPEAKPLENYFKNLLPMLQTIAELNPTELNSFKEALGQFEWGLPLSDIPLVRKILEVAPCEKFESVLAPIAEQEGLFSLPESSHLEKHFKNTLPMFQAMMNFTPNEFNSFKEVLHYHECGLPLPDIPMVRRLLEVAPDKKFKDVLAPERNQDQTGVNERSEPPMDQTGRSVTPESVLKYKDHFTPDVDKISFFKLPEVPFFEKLVSDIHGISPCSLLKLPVPKIIQEDKWAWAADEEFAREMLAGVNPVIIKRLTEFPPRSELDPKEFGNQNSAITAEIIQPNLDGISVKEALDSNRLFILDHHDTLMPYLRRINATENKVYATRTVLFLKKDGALKPVAIELSLPTPEGQKIGVIREVFSPAIFGVQGALWLLAKSYVMVNDSGVHQLISRWLRTHAVLEPFVIGTNRQLSVMHPINKLLDPHFRETMSINALSRQNLLNAGGILEFTSFPGKYAMEMSSSAYKSWNFAEQGLPADLIKRGVAVEDKSSPHHLRLLIQDYPYAVDGLEIWSAIESWVREYCAIYYPDDRTVKEDDELQSWWKEIREVGHGDLKDRPWWPKMSSVPELVRSCATIIWIASAMHAAVNFGQYHYAGYTPNRPAISRRFIPAAGSPEYEQLKRNPEKVFLETIGGRLQTLIGISLMEMQSTHASDEVYLGRRASDEWTSDAKAVEGLNRFCSKLKEAEKKIANMNQNPALKNRTGPVKMPYTLLSPYSEGGITGKGIPNSVSI